MTRKTGKKWKTNSCARCYGEPHNGYAGKLDRNGVEYVICGGTGKRMNVSGMGKEGNSFMWPTVWEEENL